MSQCSAVDVLIVGGGLVGSTFASLLSHSSVLNQKLRIAIIDPTPKLSLASSSSSVPDIRVSAISPRSADILRRCGGAWDRLDMNRVGRFDDMRVWDWFSRGKIHFSAADMEIDHKQGRSSFVSGVSEPLGYIVENNRLQAALHESLNHGNVEWIQGQVQDIQFEDTECFGMGEQRTVRGPVKVALDSNIVLETQLIVGADGARSSVKKFSDIGSVGVDYSQRGIVATVQWKNPSKTAWQRFLPTGPLAILPCFDDYASIVWTTSVAQSKELLNISDEEFLALLNRCYSASPRNFAASGFWTSLLPSNFESLLGVLFNDSEFQPPLVTNLVSKRAAFPLQIQQSQTYIKPRVALIGDAAHVVHPLAGQGVNLGFEDASCLASCIEDALNSGQDHGDVLTLEPYDRKQRLLTNSTKMLGIHSLQRLFSIQNGPVALARGVGLDLVNSIPLLKNKLASIAIKG